MLPNFRKKRLKDRIRILIPMKNKSTKITFFVLNALHIQSTLDNSYFKGPNVLYELSRYTNYRDIRIIEIRNYRERKIKIRIIEFQIQNYFIFKKLKFKCIIQLFFNKIISYFRLLMINILAWKSLIYIVSLQRS